MAEANANIKFTADTSQALESIRQLQRSISRLYSDMARGAAGAQSATAGMQQNLINSVNATGQFTARLTTIRTTTESFTNALEKNKLSLGQYFKFGIASTEKFGSVFKTEFNTIEKVARERVKDLQTQYIKMGRDANGAMKAIAVRPTTLDMTDLGTQTAIAAQKQQIFNQLLKQGTTNLLNFGKNTQWAGRQLMVGFTIPLSIFAVQAARSFQQLEAQAINFKRVYGDLFTTPEQTEMALTDMRKLALEFTKLGVTVEETLALAAKVAQMGATGQSLTAQVTEATRLSVLGQMQQQEALDTTIGITDAFGISLEQLTDKVNFLNAAENQTILSIQDFNQAVPRAGSVVAQLGGGVEDLAFFLTAMREGGVEASQGANALKTSLARLISPTEVAKKELGALGINIGGIVEENAGNLRQTVIDLALALDTLDPLDKSRAIEQLFGKFQFARMSALFQNIIDEGSQASTILDLMGASTSELAALADRELGRVEASSATKFASAIAQFNAALAPVGESFLKLATPIIEWATGMVEAFNKLGEGGRGFVVGFLGVIGGLAPVLLMVIGLVANLVANLAKGVGLAFNFFKGLGGGSKNLAEQTNYMSSEQIEAQTVAASLNQTHQNLIQTFTGEREALKLLGDAYRTAAAEMRLFQGPIMTAGGMASRPQTKAAGFAKGRKVSGYKDGVIEVPGPKGKGDIIPAMLAPGEAVIPAEMAQRYGGLINAMIAGNIPGYEGGLAALRERFKSAGSSPVEASHVAGYNPNEFPQTLQIWVETIKKGQAAVAGYSEGLLEAKRQIFSLSQRIQEGSPEATAGGPGVVGKQIITPSEGTLASFVESKPAVASVGGETYPGAAIVTSRAQNQAITESLPDGQPIAPGIPLSLDGVVTAGQRAQVALDTMSDASEEYRAEWTRLVAEGRRASSLLSDSNSADEAKIAYTREVSRQLLVDRALAADGVTQAEAESAASARLVQADNELAKLRAAGMDEAELVQQAEAQYGVATLDALEIKKLDKAGQPTGKATSLPPAELIAGHPGDSRERIRHAGSRGSSDIINEAFQRASRSAGELAKRFTNAANILAKKAQSLISGGADEVSASSELAQSSPVSRALDGVDPLTVDSGKNLAKQTKEALAEGVAAEVQSNSPAKRLVEVSRDVADGIQLGLEESIPELQQTGAKLGEALNDGAESSQGEATERRGNRRARRDQDGVTDVMQGGEIIKTIYPPEVQQAQGLLAQVNLQNAAKAQAFGDQAALATQKIMDMSGKAAMAGFALTSVLGAATQIPGPMGEIAAKAMPIVGGFTALSGVLRMVNAQEAVNFVRKKAEAVSLAFSTATTKVATSATVINTLAKRGETVASAQLVVAKRAELMATVVSGGIMKGLGAALGILFGKVGLIVLGLAAIGLAIWAVVRAYQAEQERIEGLGNAAKLTGDQLKVLSDILGVEFRSSAFDTQAQAGASGAIEPEDVNAIAQLRDSEEFKTEFSGIISALKGATRDQATVMLEAQAAQLTSLAKTEEDLAKIPFILRAQMEEAGVEGIDVEILIPDLTSIDGVAERVRTAIEPISNIGLLSGRALTEQMSITSGAISSTIVMLEQMRNTAVITPQEAAEQFALLSEEINSIDDPGKKFKLMDGVIEDLQMDDLAKDIKDTDLLLSLVADRMQGLETPQDVIDLFKAASETNLFGQSTADPEIIQQAKDLAAARTAEAAETRLATDATNELNAAKDIMTQEMAAANESIGKQIEDLSNQSLAYDRLVEAGFSAADAIAAVGDATLAAAIASAAAGPDLDALIERVQTLDALKAETEVKLGGRRGGGGGGTPTSVLDDVTKKLRLFNRAQTSVTKGWNASMKAILDFANASNILSGEFNGLNKQLRKIGLTDNLIEMIAGMDPDEYEKRKNELFVFDDKGSIIGMTSKLQSLNDAINSVVIGEFINTQEQLVNSVNNQITALTSLTAAGASYEAAYRAVQNTALAAAIATARSSEMIRAAANAAMEAQRMMDKFATINEEEERRKNIAKAVQAINKEFSNQAKILDYINRNRSKLSEAQISEILTNKDLTALVLEPSIDPRALATALDNANKQAQLELSIKKLTVEGQEQIFQDGLGKAMDLFNAEGNKIEFEFEASIKDQRKIIKDAEEQIALLDFELQTYQNDLKDIEFQEDEINKAYDKRFEALDKIAEANAEISRQQQAQLDVADALSRGDIAGAARAVREAREASGEVARERERKMLEQAQASQLGALTSSRGLTREEAEARSVELEQQIFAIESDRLMPAEELVRLAELKRDADIESLEILGKTREEYEKIANAIDVARGNNWQNTEAIQEALNIVENLIAELEKAKPVPVAATFTPAASGNSGRESSSQQVVAPKTVRPSGGTTEPTAFEYAPRDVEMGSGPVVLPKRVTPTPIKKDVITPSQSARVERSTTVVGRMINTVQDTTAKVINGVGTAVKNFFGFFADRRVARGGMIIPKRMSIGGIARRARSGPPLQMLEGGSVRGPGTDMSDSIPALLSNGEYVIRASAVRNVGEEFLDKLNGGKIKPKDKDGLPAFKGGGIVRKRSTPVNIRQIENAAAKKTSPAPTTIRKLLNTKSTAAATSRILAEGTGGSTGSPDRIEARIKAIEPLITENIAKDIKEYVTAPRQSIMSAIQQTQIASRPQTPVWDGQMDVPQPGSPYFNQEEYLKNLPLNQRYSYSTPGTQAVMQADQRTTGERLMDKAPALENFLKGIGEFFLPITMSQLSQEGAPLAVAPIRRGATDASLVDDLLNMPFAGDIALYASGSVLAGAASRFLPRLIQPLRGLAGAGPNAGTVTATTIGRPTSTPAPLLGAGTTPSLPINSSRTQTTQSIIRQEQNEIANRTQEILNAKRQEGFRSGEIIDNSYNYNLIEKYIEALVRSDKNSSGPALTPPKDFYESTIHISDLTPSQLREAALMWDHTMGGLRRPAFSTNPNLNITSPFMVRTDNQRLYMKELDPIREFLTQRGIIKPSSHVKDIHEELRRMNLYAYNSEVGNTASQYLIPQVGPLPSVYLQSSILGKKSQTSFASGGNETFPLTGKRPNDYTGIDQGFATTFFRLSGMEKRNTMGPFSTYMARDRDTIPSWQQTRTMDTFFHENSHRVDNFRRLTGLPPIFRSPGTSGASAEATAKAAEAIRNRARGGPGEVDPYVSGMMYDLDKLVMLMKHRGATTDAELAFRGFVNTYVDGPRRDQVGADWLEEYLHVISLAQKNQGIQVHSRENLAALQRLSLRLGESKISSFGDYANIHDGFIDLLKREAGVVGNPFINVADSIPPRQTISSVGSLLSPSPSPRAPAFELLEDTDLTEIDIPLGVSYEEGVFSDVSRFAENLSGNKFFVKGHLTDGEYGPEVYQSFGHEFLAGRIGNFVGANTPQAYIVKRSSGKEPFEVATDVVPQSSGLDPTYMKELVTLSDNPYKTLDEIVSAFADYVETTPALNAVMGNYDQHYNNILWDAVNKKFVQIDFGTSHIDDLKMAPGIQSIHPKARDAYTLARTSMAIVRDAVSHSAEAAVENQLLSQAQQLAIINKLNNSGFNIKPNRTTGDPLFDTIPDITTSQDYSQVFKKIAEFDHVSQLPDSLQFLDKWALQTIKDRASVLSGLAPFDLRPGDHASAAKRLFREKGLGFMAGGFVKSRNTDNIPAMLTAGEYVVRRSAVENFGVGNLEKINNGTYNNGSMYNYNLSVNVKSESNPDQIARTVIDQIKRIDSQRIRGNRF